MTTLCREIDRVRRGRRGEQEVDAEELDLDEKTALSSQDLHVLLRQKVIKILNTGWRTRDSSSTVKECVGGKSMMLTVMNLCRRARSVRTSIPHTLHTWETLCVGVLIRERGQGDSGV